MNITYRPMTAMEAWNFIQDRHRSFHTHLKHFGYGYKMFIPNHPKIQEMYEQETLSPEQLSEYRDIFINQIYNKERLQKFDDVLERSAVPVLKKVVEILVPMAHRWGIKFPDDVEILTTYGASASYDSEYIQIVFRMTRLSGEGLTEYIIDTLRHEFIHLLIERPIIKQYNVPQDLKERIVDIIGYEYFGIPIQPRFEKSFANKYITKESIEKDLPGTVKKMMMDYIAFHAKARDLQGKV